MVKELNILLLGQSGFGKSTFINSFYNYLLYNNLDQALDGPFETLIPSMYSLLDPETYETKEIIIGQLDPDEIDTKVGNSQTQKCKTYVFEIKNVKIRLIDAPGICDNRGLEQDRCNIEHILKFVSQYEQLHTIVLTLKPGEARLNIQFTYTIKEILSNLHKTANDILMFVFTHGRTSFFLPGDTAPILKKFLKEIEDTTNIPIPFDSSNTICIDNECFPYISRIKNGISVTEIPKEKIAESWEKSSEGFVKLLERAAVNTPHKVSESLSINEAKKLIGMLHRPMAEVSKLIEENIEIAHKQKLRLQELDLDIDSILSLKNLTIEQYAGVQIPLGYPRTVCTSPSCTEIINIEGVENINYTAHCHEHCFLDGVPTEVMGHSILISCSAMNSSTGLCLKCGCSWDKHMHISYEYRKIRDIVDLPLTVETEAEVSDGDQISSLVLSAAEKSINTLIDKLKREQLKILFTSARLGAFLKKYAIVPYNDDFEKYLDYYVSQKHSGTSTANEVNNFEEMRERYQQQVAIFDVTLTLDNYLSDSKPSLTPTADEVSTLIAELYDLPLNGDKIRQQMDLLNRENKKTFEKREVIVPLPPINDKSTTLLKKISKIV